MRKFSSLLSTGLSRNRCGFRRLLNMWTLPTVVRPQSSNPVPLRRHFCSEAEEEQGPVPEIEELLKQVGCEEYADKFESLEQFTNLTTFELKTKYEIDTIKHRKKILKQVEFASQLKKHGLLKQTIPTVQPTEGDVEDNVESEVADSEGDEIKSSA
mmetsp:Transcript_4901/g.11731  ORF Transcript_4901/g.11731 Transcript_4901/m.11731 type:complete len:156 (+) Transcript_4901:133-600(+)